MKSLLTSHKKIKEDNKPFAYWSPSEIFKTEFERLDKNTRFFGVELEYEPDYTSKLIGCATNRLNIEQATEVYENQRRGMRYLLENGGRYGIRGSHVEKANYLTRNFAVVKTDGSLSSQGIELCTRPLTLNDHSYAWRRFFSKIKWVGLYSHEETGLHVHVSRNMETHKSIFNYRLVKFLYTHQNYLSQLGREGNEWCHYPDSNNAQTNHQAKRFTQSHYSCVNCSKGVTYEFRIFQSATDYNSLMMALQLCDAIMDFCENKMYANRPDTYVWRKFLEFVYSKRHYRHLQNKIEALNLV